MPKAFVFTSYGGPENETVTDLPTVRPGPGQVMVAVVSAGVNPVDWKIRNGYLRAMGDVPMPALFGRELSGVVRGLGEDVTDFAIGDAVFGNADGTLAEYATVDASMLTHKPDAVSFEDAGVLAVAGTTAFEGLRLLDLADGDTVLINGIGGGVGVVAAQLATQRGLRVLGTASAQKREYVESLGAEHIEYGDGVADRIRALAPDGVDGVFDLVGGDALRAVAPTAKSLGKVTSAADMGVLAELGALPFDRRRGREVLDDVAALAAEGRIDPHITERFDLDSAAEALARVESGHAVGKIVVNVADEPDAERAAIDAEATGMYSGTGFGGGVPA